MTKQLTIIKKVDPLIIKAEELVVEDSAGLKEAIEVLSELNQWSDRVEEDRTKLTAPLNKTLKEINSRYKPLKDALELTVERLRARMSEYQGKALRARAELELRFGERVEKGSLKAETAVRRLDELGTVEKSIEGENGSVSFIELEKFAIEDLSLVPIEYHLANEVMIRKAMKEKIYLPGVKYWTTQSVRNSR